MSFYLGGSVRNNHHDPDLQDGRRRATVGHAGRRRQGPAAQGRGHDVFDFSLGEPDFTTPEHICEAAYQGHADGHTHYTPAAGIAELAQRHRPAITRRPTAWKSRPEQVIVSNGAKHSLHNALAATVGPGDEVIIPTPYWVSYSDLVQMTGATYVLVPTTQESGFKMTPAQLKAAITPRTPAGDAQLAVQSRPAPSTRRQELEALADVVLELRAGVLSDEIYEQLVYGDAQATCFATLRPGLAERTITISGVSKSYAMTGWRMGWAVGPCDVIKAMGNVQSQETSNPCSISQYAALAALEGDQECVEEMRREFEARRDLVCQRLSDAAGH